MDNFEKPLECCRCTRNKYRNSLCKMHYEHFLNKFGEEYFDSPKKYHKELSNFKKKPKKRIELVTSLIKEVFIKKNTSSVCSECNAYTFKDGLCSFHYRFINGLMCVNCYSKLYKNSLCLKCYNKGNV